MCVTRKGACIALGIRSISYHIKSAFHSVFLNRLMSVASILTVACCLFLFGVFLLFTVNVNYLGDQIQAQCEIQAFMDIDISDADAQKVYDEISKLDNVKQAVFETKAQAMENYKEQLGGDAVALEGLEEDNFLRNSVKITLNDLSQANVLVEKLKTIPGVDDVKNRQDIMDSVLRVTNYIKNTSLVIMIILTVVALFIISNTIKLSVNARANEIHIMKYVGATDWFIRWPFVIEGIIVGIVGGILALLVLFAGYGQLYNSLKDFFDIFKLYSFGQIGFMLCGLVMLFGIFMGSVGSIIAIRRHLRV